MGHHLPKNESNELLGMKEPQLLTDDRDHFAEGKEKPQEEILEPIAVIGLSFKFPEDATSEDSFWEMLLEKRSAATEFPKDRMNIDAFHSTDTSRLNTISTRKAHFLQEDIRAFDAPFFSIPPSEAASLDPQQRRLLEATYHALENAGIPLDKAKGSDTSVHVGCFTNDFNTMSWRDAQQIPKYSATGSATSIISNRISWWFDLTGSSMTIDTACSSGMVALDVACTGLWLGKADMGIVAGVNMICSPEMTISMSNMNFLSPEGKSFSFDHRANGYGRGEGLGVLVLKPLSTAVRDGDTIRALIRSTGSNSDGHTPGGLTQPSRKAQSRLIDYTYRRAGLGLGITRFVEAHGTGTAIGDPIEARAIGESFKTEENKSEHLYIGAVKSNIGHLEGASGLASVIKTIMVLEKAVIPPNTNFESLNPKIDAEFLRLKFPTEVVPWPGHGVRRASVNSFGFGGANAHAVLDDAYHYLRQKNIPGNHRSVDSPPKQDTCRHIHMPQTLDLPQAQNKRPASPKLLIWSAADEAGLSRLATLYGQHIANHKGCNDDSVLQDLAFTLYSRRTSLPWKSFVITDSVSALRRIEKVLSKPVQASTIKLKVGFVFTGQGAQWYGMGRELLKYPLFKESLLRAQIHLGQMGCGWLLLEELTRDETMTRVNEPEFSQPMCTSIQIALVDLLQELCVTPDVVIGHSSGEIAAAYCTGSISMKSAMKISYFRGVLASKLAKTTSSRHSMVSVGLSKDQVITEFGKIGQQQDFDGSSLTVSCINSPKNVTISGPEGQLDTLVSHMEKRKIFARKLYVKVGYHSPQMSHISEEYLQRMGTLECGTKPTNAIMMSSVSCDTVSMNVLCKGEYWVRNMVSPVNFLGALRRCCSRIDSIDTTKKLDRSHIKEISVNTLLEIGPHSALQGPIRDTLTNIQKGIKISYNSVLVRNRPAVETLLVASGQLYCQGLKVDINKLNNLGPSGNSRVPQLLTNLPSYPFNHSVVYWDETRINKGFRFRQHPTHDLLGSRASDWNQLEARWRLVIRFSELPWVEDHKVNGSILYPAAGMLAMAIEAMKQIAEIAHHEAVRGYEIKDVEFHTPLVFSTTQQVTEVQICLRPSTHGMETKLAWHEYRVYQNRINEEWEELSRGSVRADFGNFQSDVDDVAEEERLLQQIRSDQRTTESSCCNMVEKAKLYQQLNDLGLEYGPSFQALDRVHFSNHGEALAKVEIFEPKNNSSSALSYSQTCVIHPTTLDGMFQLVFVALSKGGSTEMSTMVPTRLNRLWVSSSGVGTPFKGAVDAFSEAHLISQRSARCSVSVLSEGEKALKVQIEGFEVASVSTSRGSLQDEKKPKPLCYYVDRRVDHDMLDEQQTLEFCEKEHQSGTEHIKWLHDIDFLCLSFASAAPLDACIKKPPRPLLKNYASWIHDRLNHAIAIAPDHLRQQMQDLKQIEFVCQRLATTCRGKLVAKVGRNLTQLLLGEIDPENLFSKRELQDVYNEHIRSSRCFKTFAKYLDSLAHKNPGMRILELGGGCGSTTEYFLETLAPESSFPRYLEYTFTDPTPQLVEMGASKFKDNKHMAFHVLDIENGPSTQGLADASYDLVIAPSVFNRTKNLKESVANAQKLLKTGGKLILFEVTAPDSIRTGFVDALLPTWWKSSENYRQKSPYIYEKKWDEVLKQNGFNGSGLVFHDCRDHESQEWSIMVSTSVGKPSSSVSIPNAVAVLEKSSSFQQNLLKELHSSFERVGSSITEELTLEQAAMVEDKRTRHFIFLTEAEHPFLPNIDANDFSALQCLLCSTGSFLWVTQGGGEPPQTPEYGMVQGLCRVSRQEHTNVALVTLALENTTNTSCFQQANNITKVFQSMISRHSDDSNYESEYIVVNGLLEINRVRQATALNEHVFSRTTEVRKMRNFTTGPPLKLSVRTPGLLDSLEFIEDNLFYTSLGPEEVEVKVHATGVNFKELLTILGRVNTDYLGSECSGVISRVGQRVNRFQPGDRVILFALDTYRSYARGNSDYALKIPDDLSFTDAAAIPLAFCTTYYSLCEVGRLQKGESILIHAASGSTGQAAIQIALHIGAEIFATVGSLTKKKVLMDIYGIPPDHIFYSRDTSFASGIKRITKDRGVDMVLNSLSGEGLVASWECIAQFGRFLEIGRRDIDSHGSLPMYPFIKNASFTGVDLVEIIKQRPALIRKMLEYIMPLVVDKTFSPGHPVHKFPVSGIEQAFRFLQSGQSSGKIVLEITTGAIVPTCLRSRPSYRLDANATYLIAGGFGGIGRSISRWLVGLGARNLILLSRTGPEGNNKARALLTDLRLEGVHIYSPPCDITDLLSLQRVVEKSARTMPPIQGCIQASMVLRDATFSAMSLEDWKASVDPKVRGSWNLHRALPQGMQFFILLSSVVGIYGNPGQSNYAAGNTYQDTLARYRVSCGEKATALDLGVILSEGVVAENVRIMEHLKRLGFMLPLTQDDLFSLLEYHCNPSISLPEVGHAQIVTGLELPAKIRAKGDEVHSMLNQPLFRKMHQINSSGQASSPITNQGLDFRTLFENATSSKELELAVAEALRKKMSKALGIPLGGIELKNRVDSYGVDSLVAVELRNWILKELQAEVAVFEILGGATLTGVGQTIVSKSAFQRKGKLE